MNELISQCEFFDCDWGVCRWKYVGCGCVCVCVGGGLMEYGRVIYL